MKKTFLILLFCFLIAPLFVHAGGCKDDYIYFDAPAAPVESPPAEKAPEAAEDVSSQSSGGSSGFRIKDRRFEIGLSANANFFNNFISADDIFQKEAIIDLNRMPEDFMLSFGFGLAPFHVAIRNRLWGYGLSTNVTAVGALGLPGDLFSLKQAVDKKSTLSGAVFVEAGLDLFFNISRFKVTFRPAAYYPLIYFKSNISYTFVTSNGIDIDIGADSRVYTAFAMNNFPDDFIPTEFVPTASLGIDFSFGVEFPLTRVLGLQKVMPFLDFDVGVNFVNVPVSPSKMKNYMEYVSSLTIKGENFSELMDSFDDLDLDSLFNDPVYGEASTTVERPFRMNVFLNWRPFGKDLFTLIPSMGYSINPFYIEPFSMEYGLKARLDIANIFVLTAGMNLEDRVWINSLDLALNIRLIELNIGVDTRSQNFLNVFNAAGLGAKVGIRLGW